MSKFKYTHPVSTHATLNVSGKNVEVSMHENEVIELPEDNSFVKLLVKQGKIQPVVAQKEDKK